MKLKMTTLFQTTSGAPGDGKRSLISGGFFKKKKTEPAAAAATVAPPPPPPPKPVPPTLQKAPEPAPAQKPSPAKEQATKTIRKQPSSDIDDELRRHMRNEGLLALAFADPAEIATPMELRQQPPAPATETTASKGSPQFKQTLGSPIKSLVNSAESVPKVEKPPSAPAPVETPERRTASATVSSPVSSPKTPQRTAKPEAVAAPLSSPPSESLPEQPQRSQRPQRSQPSPPLEANSCRENPPKPTITAVEGSVSVKPSERKVERPPHAVEPVAGSRKVKSDDRKHKRPLMNEHRDSGKFVESIESLPDGIEGPKVRVDPPDPELPPAESPLVIRPDSTLMARYALEGTLPDEYGRPQKRHPHPPPGRMPRRGPPPGMGPPGMGPPPEMSRRRSGPPPSGHFPPMGPGGPRGSFNGRPPPQNTDGLQGRRPDQARRSRGPPSGQSRDKSPSPPESRPESQHSDRIPDSKDDSGNTSSESPTEEVPPQKFTMPTPVMLPPNGPYDTDVGDIQRNCTTRHRYAIYSSNVHHRIQCMVCSCDVASERFLCGYCALRFCPRCKNEFNKGRGIDEIRQLALYEDWKSQRSEEAPTTPRSVDGNIPWEIASTFDAPRMPFRLRNPPNGRNPSRQHMRPPHDGAPGLGNRTPSVRSRQGSPPRGAGKLSADPRHFDREVRSDSEMRRRRHAQPRSNTSSVYEDVPVSEIEKRRSRQRPPPDVYGIFTHGQSLPRPGLCA